MLLIGNDYCMQIIETAFAEYSTVLALSKDMVCTDFVENFSLNSLKGDLTIDTTFNPPLFSLVNTFEVTC
jgi:hypothetical protein